MTTQKYHILYVEDDTDSSEMMKVWLQCEDNSYKVIVASSVDDAISLITRFPFDLYLLDYCLPIMSGAEFCRLIRANDDNTPVLMYSALARPIDRKMAMQAGANVYLVKPDDFDKLGPAIRQLLGISVPTLARPGAYQHRTARSVL